MVRQLAVRFALLCLGVVLTACQAEKETNVTAAVRDSAGIAIVDNRHPLWKPASAWSVGRVPRLVIGREDGDPRYVLFRISSLAILSDGRIAVANSGTGEIRVYSPGGQFLVGMGGRGRGPAEFTQLSAITAGAGDTITAWDGLDTVKRFTAGGRFLDQHEWVTDATPRFVNAWRPSRSGVSFYLLYDQSETRSSEPIRPREWLALMRFGANSVDTLGLWPSELGREVEFEGGTGPLGSTSRWVRDPLTPATQMAVGGEPERLVVGDGAHPLLKLYDLGGHEVMEVRWHPLVVEPSKKDVEMEIQAATARYPGPEAARRARVLRDFTHDSVPFFDRLFVDDVGSVWARRFVLPTDSIAAWSVFNSSGEWLGRLDLPLRLRVMQIGPDFIAGVQTDSLDVEQVAIYGLARSGKGTF